MSIDTSSHRLHSFAFNEALNLNSSDIRPLNVFVFFKNKKKNSLNEFESISFVQIFERVLFLFRLLFITLIYFSVKLKHHYFSLYICCLSFPSLHYQYTSLFSLYMCCPSLHLSLHYERLHLLSFKRVLNSSPLEQVSF